MASNPLDLPILISQLPNVQQMLGPQYVPPEAAQALFGEVVANQQRKEEQNVQEVDKQEGTEAMGRDSGGNHEDAQSQRQAAARRARTADEEDASATQSSNASPWTGNIINVKI